jgi:DNA-binding NarL/FixJ family response regulator
VRRLRLLVVEDHPLVVEAIRVAVADLPDFEIAGVADSGTAVVPLARELQPDVILLDLRLPGVDGIDVLHALRREKIGARCVVLSASDEADVVELAFRAGASVFISKRIDPHDLPAALRQAVDQTVFQPFAPNPLLPDAHDAEGLTQREITILEAVAEGLSNKEIARRLSYAEQTIKLELTHVYQKLGVSSRTEALAVGFRRGLIRGGVGAVAPTA